MEQVHMIGIDLAKNSFQLHGARADGSVAFRKKLSRAKLLDFVAAQPRCTVAMEACGGAHHWGREIGSLGHAVRLVPPIYVKAYVKRQKNDASDAAHRATAHIMGWRVIRAMPRGGSASLFSPPMPVGLGVVRAATRAMRANGITAWGTCVNQPADQTGS